jgi:hypothetical protein
MSKYQEALNNVERVYVESEHYDEEDINLLQELIDQQSNPTFEQVIKEWEAAGYFYIEDDDCIYFDDDSRFIRIYKKTKEYCICDMFGTGICFNMKEHDLIHKIIQTM